MTDARHCCPNSVWQGARWKVDEHPRPKEQPKPHWMRAATRWDFFSELKSVAMLHCNPIPFQVAGGAMDQTFLKLCMYAPHFLPLRHAID